MVQEKLRFIKLCSDTAFKYLYKNPKFKSWFDEIIFAKCGLDLSSFQLVDNEDNTGNNFKDYRMDLVLKKEETIIIIEMNDFYYPHLRMKNYSYLYRLAGKRFDMGENYHLVETKLILLNNYYHEKNQQADIAHYALTDSNTNDVIKDIEIFEIYLPKFKNICYDNNEMDVRLSLFQKESYEEMRNATNNPKDLKIIEELERLAMDEKFIYAYDHEAVRKKEENSIRSDSFKEGLERGQELGLKQGQKIGLKQGAIQRNIEIAKSMLKEKITLDIISKCTNLSLSEINKLKEKEC